MEGQQQGPAPAPLDLGRLEVEAKAAAAKHVANLLQKPEQLEKVDQYKRRVSRKKASVEAMLKTAVQSQLDGVRTGLNQLQSALQDVYEIKQSLDEVDENYKVLQPLHEKLSGLREENKKFCRLAAACENLRHIFTVPESVERTRNLIAEGKLLQAHKHLTDLELSRDDLLLELHKQPNQSPTDRNTLNNYFAEVEKLSEELGKQLWIILHRTLISVRREPKLIVTALRIIEREERMDSAYKERQKQTGFLPPGRPKCWRKKTFQVLKDCIEGRMEGTQLEDRTSNKMWLVRHLEILRQLMIEDLKVVKTLLPPVCPPEYDIVNSYTLMYHKALSQHLCELINQKLEGNEIVSLLQWVHAYDSPELLKHPDLNIASENLGPLLKDEYLNLLQNLYLKNMKQNIADWTKNSLKTDNKDWCTAEMPDADGDGYYTTALPVILFQMMEQNLQVAQIISIDLVKKVLELFSDELKQFASEYAHEIKIFKEKHLANRNDPKYFLHYVIANANNCLSFGDYMKELRGRYLKNEFEEEGFETYEESDIRKDRFQLLTDRFTQIARLCINVILDEFFIDLRDSNCMNELMTRTWIHSMHAVDTICATWADYNQDFVHLKPKNFTMLVEVGQRKILLEYLRAILARKLTFKNYDERREACDKICREARQMKDLFQEMAPKQNVGIFDVLPAVSEVLKLRDTSMLTLEVMGLVKKYPDIRLEQLINLILCRGDMNRADARQLAMDALGEDEVAKHKPRGLFSDLAT
ncbi:exocyst complex component 3-like [Gigantopelta aegis]|uniref:exocyst complex component 3-like n=1 Tax=Gigantopelta aegis TaxID=1735272 RepID=UPI001B88DA02|nr:exocyst complex component 3-like [Gigantopelta aegis]XP_041361119.1 exocyst complex component 3-like [Gigantopelta aegis]XP_041361120.1 exocyst complex component 3-like [Gigantopelta aegis]XP_041361121.1 exocyst complex component 3-like [Gigantopelta aegis]